MVVQEHSPVARERLVRSNLRLVVNVAKRYTNRGMSLGDLIAEGNLGLIKAVDYFDPDHGTRFSTYAAWWIKQSIRLALLKNMQPIQIPVYMVALINQWRHLVVELTSKLGRTPEIEEIADAMQLSIKKARKIHRVIQILGSVEDVYAADDPENSESVQINLMERDAEKPEDILIAQEQKQQAVQLLEDIEPREANILKWYYGLDGREPLSLSQISERLGLTRERVRQLQHEALLKLYEYMNE